MPKILIADDQPDLREMIRLSLSLSGYHVLTAPDGHVALEVAAGFGPDLIIVDARMPGPSGPALCARLHDLAATHGAPILLISGMADCAEIQAALEAGAREYLRKPFELNHLLDRVDALLHQA